MVELSRYNVKNEDNFILQNKLNIINQKILEDTETILLNDTYTHFLKLLETNKLKLNLKLLFDIHNYFLKPLYSWAGKTRNVDISKDNILFCTHAQIKKELDKFKKILIKNLPSTKDNKKLIAKKISIIHCEFNAIHPFREGNGRTIRLFLDLLSINIGYNLIDYSQIGKKDYITASKAGMIQDYSKMEAIIYKGLSRNY